MFLFEVVGSGIFSNDNRISMASSLRGKLVLLLLCLTDSCKLSLKALSKEYFCSSAFLPLLKKTIKAYLHIFINWIQEPEKVYIRFFCISLSFLFELDATNRGASPLNFFLLASK